MINLLLRIFYKIYPKYRFITPKEIDKLLDKLKIDFDPDIIIGVLNGGYYPAKKIAKKMNKRLEFLKVKHYSTKIFGIEIEYFPIIKRILYFCGFKEKTKLIKNNSNVKGKNILIVDDESGNGDTINLVKDFLKDAKRIKTVVLVSYGPYNPDYYAIRSKKLFIMPWVEISPYHKLFKSKIKFLNF